MEKDNINRIIVICALDRYLQRVEKLLPNIQEVFGQEIAVGIGSFGPSDCYLDYYRLEGYVRKHRCLPSIEPSVQLKTFAESRNLLFYDAPRQGFLPVGREHHCSELLALIDISKHFYDLQFDLVYLVHSDVRFICNFFSLIEPKMVGNWSFIAPEIFTHNPDGSEEYRASLRELMYSTPSKQKESVDLRISQECIIFNKEFIHKFYETYKTIENAWAELFHEFSLFGDVSLFDIAKDFLGFNAILVPRFVQHS